MSFEATITSVHQMTPRVKQFVVERDEPFEFEPGQHTNVEFEQADPDEDEDAEVSRPYTATNTPGNDAITLAIKRYDDGTASVYMHDRDPGDTITLAEFHGELSLRDTDEDVVFVSTGTGITPMMAMLKQYLEEGTGEAHFLYGEKNQENLMYRRRSTSSRANTTTSRSPSRSPRRTGTVAPGTSRTTSRTCSTTSTGTSTSVGCPRWSSTPRTTSRTSISPRTRSSPRAGRTARSRTESGRTPVYRSRSTVSLGIVRAPAESTTPGWSVV